MFENLVEGDFDIDRPDQVYAADITCVWTQAGWLYLAVLIDLCAGKVVGWSMSSRMKTQFVCDALQMAIWRRQPKVGLIHHSDRGSQYASKAFRRLLKAHGIEGSMSRNDQASKYCFHRWWYHSLSFCVAEDIVAVITVSAPESTPPTSGGTCKRPKADSWSQCLHSLNRSTNKTPDTRVATVVRTLFHRFQRGSNAPLAVSISVSVAASRSITCN